MFSARVEWSGMALAAIDERNRKSACYCPDAFAQDRSHLLVEE
jgi:hypothetical protein